MITLFLVVVGIVAPLLIGYGLGYRAADRKWRPPPCVYRTCDKHRDAGLRLVNVEDPDDG